MRKILVTGGNGFIGSAVCAALLRLGDVPRIFDWPETVLSIADLSRAMDGMDGVINLAGVLGTEETIGAEKRAAEVNIVGAINVYTAAAAHGIPVVQIGTGHKGQPNPYAITKAAAEDLGLARARYCNQQIVVVRAFHVYGPGQSVCPPHGRAKVRKIVPSFACRALSGMTLEINGSGKQLIDLVHVDQVALALVDGLARDPGTLIEAGTGKPTSVIQAARDIIEACNSDSEIAHLAMRPGEPPDATVVAESPGCPAPWPYKLDDTIAYYRDVVG